MIVDWISDHVWFVLVVFVGLLIALAIYSEHLSQEELAAKHCHAVGRKDGTNGIGFTGDGRSVVTYNPSQTVYQCDGGEIIIH